MIKSRHSKIGRAAVVVLVLILVLAVTGFAVWRWFSNRPGEQAVRLIPADVSVVVTLDTTPSAQQVALFKKIADSANSSGLLTRFDQAMSNSGKETPFFKDIRPQLKRSFAVAAWIPREPGDKGQFAVLLAVSQPQEVVTILKKYATVDSTAGENGYHFQGGLGFANIINGYLVMSDSAETLRQIAKAAKGEIENVTSLSEYRKARQQLPEDANLMFFMSPRGIESAQKASGGTVSVGYKWLSFSLTLREEGIQFDSQYPVSKDVEAAAKALAKIKPLAKGFIESLPSNAYGVVAVAQPGTYIRVMKDELAKDKKAGTEMMNGITEMEKQLGLKLDTDILTNMNGDCALAVYPTADNKGIELVVSMSDANGSDPSALCKKLIGVIEKKSVEAKEPVKFVQGKVGEITVWRLDATSQKTFAQIMKEGPKANPALGAPNMPKAMPPSSPSPSNPFANSTIIVGMNGKSVLIASSEAALTKAATSVKSPSGGLLSSGAYQTTYSKCLKNPTSVMMVDAHRILNAFAPSIREGMKGSPVNPDDLLGIFGGGKSTMICSSSTDGEVSKVTGLMPLDYDKCINVLAGLLQIAAPPSGSQRPPKTY